MSAEDKFQKIQIGPGLIGDHVEIVLLCWCYYATQISNNLFLYDKNSKDVTLKPGSVTLHLISELLHSVIFGCEK